MLNKHPIFLMLILATLGSGVAGCSIFAGRETVPEYADDTGTTADVKAAIFSEPSLKSYQIHVETMKGVVQLSGFVDSATEVRKAGQLARNVKGVKDVKNNLTVRR